MQSHLQFKRYQNIAHTMNEKYEKYNFRFYQQIKSNRENTGLRNNLNTNIELPQNRNVCTQISSNPKP